MRRIASVALYRVLDSAVFDPAHPVMNWKRLLWRAVLDISIFIVLHYALRII
jgi:hypothetical protein